MSHKDKDRAFLDAVKGALDQQHDSIDDETLSALREIRHQAINHADTQSSAWGQFQRPFYPALAAAAAVVMVLGVSLTMNLTGTHADQPTLEDMPLLTASEDISFYQNLEFYQWLDAEKLHG